MSDTIYALDFDGVICDSAIETGHSSWLAARQVWTDLPADIPETILEDFRKIRPRLETGFEGILICRCLQQGIDSDRLIEDYANQLAKAQQQAGLDDTQLKSLFGRVRDQWIKTDLPGWIAMNPLYPDMADFIQQCSAQQLYIITTKQERFVQAILQASDIRLAADRIFGMERQQTKAETLRTIQTKTVNETIVFVEDRLPTLIDILAEPDLDRIQLFLVNWGYNTEQDRLSALQHARIRMLSLDDLDKV